VVDIPSIINAYDESQTIMCTHCEYVNNTNAALLTKLHETYNIIELHHNYRDKPELEGWLQEAKFHHLVAVAVGCKIVLTENLDVGACNGAMGVVFSIKMTQDQTV
jgi:hypothetical protein